MSAEHRVSCVLPAYDEADSLAATVAEWDDALPRCTGDYEIIVVDDGSRDGTAALLPALQARHRRLRVVTHPTNRGYGIAIERGFAEAQHPLIFFTDADGQYDPADFPLLLERIDGADLVVGHRLRRADPAGRALLSNGYNALARGILGISWRDLNCAFKLMHRETFRRLGIASRGFSVNAELALGARRAGMTVVEVGVRHRHRRAGRSTVRPFHVLAALRDLVGLRLGVAAPGAAADGTPPGVSERPTAGAARESRDHARA